MGIGNIKLENLFLYLYGFSLSFSSIHFYIDNTAFSIAFITAALFILSLVANAGKYLSFLTHIKHFIYPIIVYLITLTFVSFININQYSERIVDTSFTLNVLMFIALLSVFSQNTVVASRALLSFIIGAILVSMLAFLEVGVEFYTNGRLAWMGSNPIKLSLIMSTALFALYSMDSRPNGRSFLMFEKILIFVSSILLMIFIMDSGSRTTLVITIAAFIFLISLRVMSKKSYLMPIIGLVVFIFLLFQSDVMQERVSAVVTTETTANNDALGGRVYLWSNMSDIFLKSAFIGHGLSGLDRELYGLFGYTVSAHNALLEALLYVGIFGAFLYILFLFRIYKKAYFVYKFSRDPLPMLLALTMFGFILSIHPNNAKIFWFVLAYIASRPIKGGLRCR